MFGFADKFTEAKELLKTNPRKALRILLEKEAELKAEFECIRELGRYIGEIQKKLKNIDEDIEHKGDSLMRIPADRADGWIRSQLSILESDLERAKPQFNKLVKYMKKVQE